jgi:protein associated with RNAse G/E
MCFLRENIESQQYVEFIAKNSRAAKSDGDLVMRTWEFSIFQFPSSQMFNVALQIFRLFGVRFVIIQSCPYKGM